MGGTGLPMAPDSGGNGKNYIFHVGLNKTASSYLQGLFFPALDGISVAFNTTVLDEFYRTGRFDHECYRIGDSFRPNDARAILENENADTVIVSDEGLGFPIFSDVPGEQSFTQPAEKALSADPPETFKRNMELVSAIAPNAKIIIVIRNQLGMLKSMYKQEIKAGQKISFDEYLNFRSGRFFARGKDNFFKKRTVNALALDYGNLIEFCNAKFGRDNVHTLFFEEFISDRDAFLKRILAVLGRGDDSVPQITSTTVYNKAYSAFTIEILIWFRRLFFWKHSFEMATSVPLSLQIENSLFSLYEKSQKSGRLKSVSKFLMDLYLWRNLGRLLLSSRRKIELLESYLYLDWELYSPTQKRFLTDWYAQQNQKLDEYFPNDDVRAKYVPA